MERRRRRHLPPAPACFVRGSVSLFSRVFVWPSAGFLLPLLAAVWFVEWLCLFVNACLLILFVGVCF